MQVPDLETLALREELTEPLPGTPDPVAILTIDSDTYRRMALKLTSPLAVVASGEMDVAGSWTGFLSFFRRFL